jgi:hypothetical protein
MHSKVFIVFFNIICESMQKKGLVYNYNKRSKIHRHTYPIITKKLLVKAYLKAQSAMEYLMTYGWAILIIAVVLGALFQLGVFNANNFAPKAPPGSCQVFRPYGPGTTQFINLEGICSGELPQYVAQFNGQSSYISTNLKFPESNTINFTVTGWINPNLIIPHNPGGVIDTDNGNNGWGLYYFQGNPGVLDFWILGQGYTQDMGFGKFYPNKWSFFAITYWYTGGAWYADGYENGVLVSGPVQRGGIVEPLPFGIEIGQMRHAIQYMNGSIANLQIYNVSLSANEIQALYLEGIGGAPIDLQHLVGWWPLNGNANDYSGNGNNGVPTNVKFVSNWWQGYTPP